MKVLFICHVEDMFERLFPLQDSWEYGRMIDLHIEMEGYDRVIALDSEVDRGPIDAVKNLSDDIWGWSWGYYPDEDMVYPASEEGWIIESSGHDFTWVLPEIREDWLKHADIDICGGADIECLEDWRCVLEYVGLKYNEVRHLIW